MQVPAFMSFWYDVVPLSFATIVVVSMIIADKIKQKK